MLPARIGTRDETNGVTRSDAVEPGEAALVLLGSVTYLLDQSMAPLEARGQLATAIREVEKLIAARAE